MDAVMPTPQATSGTTHDAWRRRAVIDAPSAFRAVVRATVEGAEGAEDSPGNQAAAVIFGLLTQGDLPRLTAVLAQLMVAANRDDFAAVPGSSGPEESMGAYARPFVEFFLEASDRFRDSTGTVGDFLDGGSREEERVWRTALATIAPTMFGRAEAYPGSSPRATAAPRFVVYHYCVSLGIVSFKRSSDIKLVQPGAGAFLAGLPYTLISLVAGWWGIPWGPLWTIETIARNLMGGTDVTDAVYAAAG